MIITSSCCPKTSSPAKYRAFSCLTFFFDLLGEFGACALDFRFDAGFVRGEEIGDSTGDVCAFIGSDKTGAGSWRVAWAAFRAATALSMSTEAFGNFQSPINRLFFPSLFATTMASSNTAPAPATSVLFARGVIARLSYWSVLQIAVDQGWGGPESAQKRTWLASEIVDAFEEQDPIPDDQYIEEMLLQVMEDEFTANLEDGSAEGIAKDIVRLWEDVHAGRQDLMTRFEEQAEKLKGKKPQVEEEIGSDSGSEDDENGMDEDSDSGEAPELLDRWEKPAKEEPQVDEDGFTLVKGKGKARN